MSILFDTSLGGFALKEKIKLKKWIKAVVETHHRHLGDISYKFCNDEYLLDINISYLSHDTYTDIITFDYVEGDTISGDILISIDRIKDNAAKYKVSFEDELHRVMIHGVLHLLGFADHTDAEKAVMRGKEDEALKMWGLM